jgi:hypothetical protein
MRNELPLFADERTTRAEKWMRCRFQGELSGWGGFGRDREKLVPMSQAINGSR